MEDDATKASATAITHTKSNVQSLPLDDKMEVEVTDKEDSDNSALDCFDDSVADKTYVPPKTEEDGSSEYESDGEGSESAFEKSFNKGLAASLAKKSEKKDSPTKGNVKVVAKPIGNRTANTFTNDQAEQLLKKASLSDMTPTDNKYPVAHGPYYIVKYGPRDNAITIQNADDYYWRNNSGRSTDKLIRRNYHAVTPEYRMWVETPIAERPDGKPPQRTSAKMTKYTFELTPAALQESDHKTRCMLVHYLGDPNYLISKDPTSTTSTRDKKSEESDILMVTTENTEKRVATEEREKNVADIDSNMAVDKTENRRTSTHDDVVNMDVDVQVPDSDRQADTETVDTEDDKNKVYVPMHLIPFEEMISKTLIPNDATGFEVGEFREASHMELKDKTRSLGIQQVEECMEVCAKNAWFQEAYGNVMTLPTEGEVFPFYIGNTRKHEKEFSKPLLTDGHSWKLRKAGLLYPGSNIQVMKWDVMIKDADGKAKPCSDFKRVFYYDLTTNNAFVHYYGLSDASKRSKHGNAKHSTQIHYHNAKIIQEEIKKQTKVMPTALYNAMSSNVAPGLVGVLSQPRNVRQVRYQIKKSKEEITLNDGIVADAMHVSKYTGDNFVRFVVAEPHVSAIVMSKTAQDEFNRACRKATRDTTIITGYDTTFDYGNTYISLYGYHHPEMERVSPDKGTINESPFIAVAAMVHQKRSEFEHQVFFDLMRRNLDTNGLRVVVVTDKEFAGQPTLEGAVNLSCWNHLKNNVKKKVDDMGIKRKEEKGRVKTDLDKLFRSSTLQSYEERKLKYFDGTENVHPVWNSKEFQDYFNRNIDEGFKMKSSRWVLDGLGIDSRNGITSNPSETLNFRFKHNQPGGDKDVPQTMLELNEFMANEDRNVAQGWFGRGPYQLKPQYRHLQRDPREMPAFQIETAEEAARQINMCLGKAGEKIDVAGQNQDATQQKPTMQAAAKWLYENQRYELAVKSGTWIVGNYNQDFEKEQRMVRLKPPSCTCGASVMCPHMLCVLKATGMRPDYELVGKEIKLIDKSGDKPFVSGKKNVTSKDTTNSAIIPTTSSKKVHRIVGLFTWDPRRKVVDSTPQQADATHDITATGTSTSTSPSPLATTSKSSTSIAQTAVGSTLDANKDTSRGKEDDDSTTTATTPGPSTSKSDSTTATATTPTTDSTAPTAVTSATDSKTATSTTSLTASNTATAQSTSDDITPTASTSRPVPLAKKKFEKVKPNGNSIRYHVQADTGEVPENYYPPRNSCTIFTKHDEPIFSLINTENGKCSAVITKESGEIKNKKISPKLKHDLAKCLIYETVISEDTNLPAVEFQIAQAAREDIEDESMIALQSNKYYDGDKVEPSKHTLICYCNDPDVKGYVNPDPAFRKVVKCQKCPDKFHERCLTVHGKEIKRFQCTPCTIKTTGTFWSANGNQVHNTCTFDNLTTGMALHIEQHGHQILTEMKGSVNEEHFRTVMDHTLRGDFAQAQKIWHDDVVVPRHTLDLDQYEERVKDIDDKNNSRNQQGLPPLAAPIRPRLNTGSLFGSLNHMTYSNLKDACTFQMTKNCTDCGPITRNVSSLTVEDLQAIESPRVVYDCGRCNTGMYTLKFKNPPNKQNWLINLDIDGMEVFAPNDLMDNLPNTVKIDRREFRKQTITFFSDEIAGGHFVSAQQYNGDWVWYDGMKSDNAPMNSKRIRKLTEDGTFSV